MRALMVGAVALFMLAATAHAGPLTCGTLQSRLFVSFYKDKELSPRPEIKPGGDLPMVNVFLLDPGGDDYDGYIWCKKTDDAVAEIALDIDRTNLLRPSIAKRSEALLADVICTVVSAEMVDCDGVATGFFQSLAKNDHAWLNLAPQGWRLNMSASTEGIHFTFEPGAATENNPSPMHLSH